MKAVFLGASADSFARVYGPQQREALAQRLDMDFSLHSSLQDAALRDAEAAFSTWGMLQCSEAEIREYMPALKAVYYAAGSVQYFARPFLQCGVRVFSAWQANAVPVAQYTFAQIVLALKGFFPVQERMRASRQDATEIFGHYPGVFETKVGLLGCGAIGGRVAEMLRPLGIETLVFDPFLSPERAQALGVRKAEMADIFAQCAVVSNHLANLPQTVGIIKREHFLSMPPYATFINTARGAQLNEADLYDALTQEPTRCAVLDVLTDEQQSDQNPLRALPNCFLTPHIAGSSGNEVHRMANYMIDALDQARQGLPCPYEVTLAMLETMA